MDSRSGFMGGQVDHSMKTEWQCAQCHVTNFKRRDHCYKCSISREESDELRQGQGFDYVDIHPSPIILLRGMDILTTEENIIKALADVTTLPIKNVTVAMDDLTKTSRGFAFLHMSSMQDAMQLMDIVEEKPLVIDSKQVDVSYSKPPDSQMPHAQQSSNLANSAIAAAQWSRKDAPPGGYSAQFGTPAGANIYQHPSFGQAAVATHVPGVYAMANVAVAPGYIATTPVILQQTAAHAELGQHVGHQPMASTSRPPLHKNEFGDPVGRCPTPDTSSYQYDETSGYYFDSYTGLYYDARTQYYFNNSTQKYLYWNPEQHTYLPAVNREGSQGTTESGDSGVASSQEKKNEENKAKEPKQSRVKAAKRIAKEMEVWAKQLNQKKKSKNVAPIVQMQMQQALQTGGSVSTAVAEDPTESKTADAGFAMFVSHNASAEERQKAGATALHQAATRLVASGYGSDSESEEDDNAKITDWTKLACLLCKRQFPNKEGLIRHQEVSDLHKKNMEIHKKAKVNRKDLEMMEKQDQELTYRDRAKERRVKYGEPNKPRPAQKFGQGNKQQTFTKPDPNPNRDGITRDNVGSKMLQNMGWTEGSGLGQQQQGRVDPISTQMRTSQAGLGMETCDLSGAVDYRDAARKVAQFRYKQMSS